MTKKDRRKLEIISFLIALILISTTYIALLPVTHAQEANIQEKALTILDNVVGIETSKYNITKNTQQDSLFFDQTQDQIVINLESPEGTVNARCTFIKNQLQQIYFTDINSPNRIKQTNNAVTSAINFLGQYENYTQDHLYNDFAQTLQNIDEKANVTKTFGNMQLKITNLDQKTMDFLWTYVDDNGIRANRKNIELSYTNGQLNGFLNNWPFFNVKGIAEISGEEATAIAIDALNKFSYDVTDGNGKVNTIKGFKIAPESLDNGVLGYLNFDNKEDARDGDILSPSIQLGMFHWVLMDFILEMLLG